MCKSYEPNELCNLFSAAGSVHHVHHCFSKDQCYNVKLPVEVQRAMSFSDEALLYVNGKRFVLPQGRAEVTLLTYLRGELNLYSRNV
jgi:hypothetical protein